MTKQTKLLFGAAMAGALSAALLGGAASAQTYDDGYYRDRSETVIVRPNVHGIQKRQILGRVNGEVNPTELFLSRRVSYSDLDLRRGTDYRRLELRVRDTARGICADLAAYDLGLRNDDEDRDCVSRAVNGAMAKVRLREG
jgi:UrcA family protein